MYVNWPSFFPYVQVRESRFSWIFIFFFLCFFVLLFTGPAKCRNLENVRYRMSAESYIILCEPAMQNKGRQHIKLHCKAVKVKNVSDQNR